MADAPFTMTSAERASGQLYGGIWELFTDEEYRKFAQWMWNDYYVLHEPLGPYVKGKKTLDAGCGGGACVYMMLEEGASHVSGIDLSTAALAHTQRLVEKNIPNGMERAHLQQASVLELPFEDESFDLVFSAGVLHHTEDPEGGFAELIRVLKPGGTAWIGLYGSGGLLGNVLIPFARSLNKTVPQKATQWALNALRLSPLRKYEVLDAMYVPYRYEYRAEEVLEWLDRQGLVEPLRTDRAMHPIYKYTPWMNGEGWLGYRAFKPAK